jgi:DNA (cytosine-5)-methyltransferase 1
LIAHDELIIDNFAGGGGASTGIEMALGRSPDIAINHDAEAVSMHAANHPTTIHHCQSVWKADPRDIVLQASQARGHAKALPVGLAWFSPDCKHFSKAKGGKPVEKHIRDLAWVVVHWAKLVRPRIICLENVEEFRDWGPLIETEDGKTIPCPERKGLEFRRWVRELRRLGYKVEHRELRACDYGAPTIRKRLFLIARCDGLPIAWPAPSHGKPGNVAGLPSWRTAADCIDWSVPCPSIFERKKPLAEATMRRIARGVMRYVINAAKPFIVPVTHHGDDRCNPIDEPLRTITAAKRGEMSLVAPVIAGCGGRAGQSRPRGGNEPLATATAKADTCLVAAHISKFSENSTGSLADEPLHTAMAGAPRHALVAAFLAQHNAGPNNDNLSGRQAEAPISTITSTGAQQQIVAAALNHQYGSGGGDGDPAKPAKTITAGGQHAALVEAFLIKYYGTGGQDQSAADPMHTLTAKARMGLVMVEGQAYQITDIGMRMLLPRELFRAQGFPEGYIIDRGADGQALTKTAQIRMCGNSVCPPIAAALVAANGGTGKAQEVA